MLQHLIKALVEPLNVPICGIKIGEFARNMQSALDYGFTSVMMDGSLEADGKTPADYAYNVDITVRRSCACKRASIEGELGVLGCLKQVWAIKMAMVQKVFYLKITLTDPDEAVAGEGNEC